MSPADPLHCGNTRIVRRKCVLDCPAGGMLILLSVSTGVGSSVIFRTIIALTLASTAVHAASDRDTAEWVIRWEGRVMIEGNRLPINDISQLPPGDFRIVGVDLTGAVMVPAELQKLGTLTALARALPARSHLESRRRQ